MNGLGFPGDFLDSVVRFFDFPLENVEEGYPGDNRRDDGWFEELQTMPPSTGFFGSDVGVGGGVVKSELPSYHPISEAEIGHMAMADQWRIAKKNQWYEIARCLPLQYSNGSQPSYIPGGMSSGSTPPNVPPSNLEAPSACQISIPASVLESNCSSSSNFDQELATHAISSTSSPSEKYNPLDASLSISKLSGDIGSYHLPINPTRKPCPPSTYDRQHLPPSITPSSASGKTNPLGTKLSISKLTGDMGSYRSPVIPRSKRSSVRKRKSRKLTLLFGCMDKEKSSSQGLVASRGKIMPKKLSRVPVVFGSMDREKNCSQKPVATSTKIMPSKLLQERVTARRCTHCEISNTPQWRHGPMGPKTLCNACGVRYRLGRLFPEYRPVASPTFVASLHSNTHTKVMEIRNKSRNMPKKLSRVPVVFGSMDREKNCSQKPVATSTKIMPSKLLQERVTAQRCTHCEISNTPQWRHGPMGPKTLCNACGVRYRFGRLFPEYRPAASPTFVASLHSNTHTEVMAIRNKSHNKVAAEAEDGADAAASPPPEFVPMSSYLFD